MLGLSTSAGLGLGRGRQVVFRQRVPPRLGARRTPAALPPRDRQQLGGGWYGDDPVSANNAQSSTADGAFNSGFITALDDELPAPVLFDELSRDEMVDMLMRLAENDVEYNDLKHLCKDNGLGGKDMKYNLRAKLIRECRCRLGLPVWDKQAYKLHKGSRVKRPSEMSPRELQCFYKEREVLLPEDPEEAVGLAFAMLVVDGIISQREVPLPSTYERYPHKELAMLCAKRGLSLKGTKAELQGRLHQYDLENRQAKLAERAKRAAEREKGTASIHAPPRPPNRELANGLAEAQEGVAAVARMELLDLRVALLSRRLPIYGTREVLVDRMMDVLRRDVIECHAGLGRMMQYAQAAVGKLSPEEVLQALAERGLAAAAAREEPQARLVQTLVDDWVEAAMNPAAEPLADEQQIGGEEGFEEGEFGRREEAEGGGEGGLAEDEEVGEAFGDPTVDVGLVCEGQTQGQRDAALGAARAALLHLQSDSIWGTLRSYQPSAMPFDDGRAPAEHPPALSVGVVTAFPTPNAIAVVVDRMLAPGCTFTVAAAPVDHDGAENGGGGGEVSSESVDPNDLMLHGLRPGATYELTARLRNAAGYGPPGDPLLITAPHRQGVAVKVLYPVPSGKGEGVRQFVQLSWEELHAYSAAELDARLGAPAAAAAASLAQWAGAVDVVLPLGVAPGAETGAGGSADACVGSWSSPESRALEDSRPEFARAARALGYPAADLLELSQQEAANGKGISLIASWLQGQGLNAELTRVAVRAEAGGEVLSAGVGRGLEEIAEGAAALMEVHSVASVVLEAVLPGAVYFSCAVVSTPHGAAALPPTEVAYYDLEEDVDASEMQFERFLLLRGGKDPGSVDALIAQWMEERRQHPELLGGATAPTQQLRHYTPPASLPPGAAEGIRRAATKLFADLHLRDFAQFSGWVIPDSLPAELQRAALLLSGEQSDAGLATERQRSPARPFAELLQLDEAERAQRAQQDAEHNAAAAAASASARGSAEEDSAVIDVQDYALAADAEDPESAAANAPVLREQGVPLTQRRAVRYGTFAGIELVDKTRPQLLAETAATAAPPVPHSEPTVEVPTALPDLSSLTPAEVCCIGGMRICFNQVSIVPELGEGAGLLSQAAAAAGVSQAALTRQLVSQAAQRVGLPALPPLRECDVEAEPTEEWPLFAVKPTGDAEAVEEAAPGASMEEVGRALEEWAAPPPLPPPESYEDILAEPAQEEPEASAAVSAADQAGNDGDVLGLGSMQRHPVYDETPPSGGAAILDPCGAADPAELLARQFPGLHPTRQRVWVLCGGEGPLRDLGLQGALGVVAALQGERDLLVETYMLDPPDAGSKNEEARRVRLQRRLDLRRMGATDDELLEDFPEYHPTRIKHSSPAPPDQLDWRGVWRLAGTALPRPEVADLRRAVEAALAEATAAPSSRREGDSWHLSQQVLASARGELAAAGIAAGGSAPWGGVLSRPEPPYFCFLGDWVAAAAQQCVVVLLALPGHPSAAGPLQRLLDSRSVPFTGSTALSAELCSDRPELMRQLAEWFDYQDSAIKMPWQHTISLPELSAKCEGVGAAEALFSQLRGAGAEGGMVLRPARDAGGLGVMRVGCGRDLQVYAHAVREWRAEISADELSLEEDSVPMPVPPPSQFVVETFAEAQALQLWTDERGAPLSPPHAMHAAPPPPSPDAAPGSSSSGKDGTTAEALHRSLHWQLDNPWLEVRGCLLGGVGATACLGLTATVLEMRRLPDGSDVEVGRFDITPPPPGVLHPEAAAAAQARMQSVGDRLGLSGAAQVTALVNTLSGEMVLLEVDPHPDLTPGSLLLRQAALQTRTPTEVLRELLKVGMSRSEAAGGALHGGMEGGGAFFPEDEFAAATAAQAGAEVEMPSPVEAYFGSPYMVVDNVEEAEVEVESEEDLLTEVEDEEEMAESLWEAAAEGFEEEMGTGADEDLSWWDQQAQERGSSQGGEALAAAADNGDEQ